MQNRVDIFKTNELNKRKDRQRKFRAKALILRPKVKENSASLRRRVLHSTYWQRSPRKVQADIRHSERQQPSMHGAWGNEVIADRTHLPFIADFSLIRTILRFPPIYSHNFLITCHLAVKLRQAIAFKSTKYNCEGSLDLSAFGLCC